MTPRDVLNRLKWHDEALHETSIWYVHRGAPDDTRIVPGADIIALHHSFLELRGRHGPVMIPYHRVLRIERNERLVWERRHQDADNA